jgi:hypothetical protein
MSNIERGLWTIAIILLIVIALQVQMDPSNIYGMDGLRHKNINTISPIPVLNGSPQQSSTFAFASLCVGDSTLLGTRMYTSFLHRNAYLDYKTQGESSCFVPLPEKNTHKCRFDCSRPVSKSIIHLLYHEMPTLNFPA